MDARAFAAATLMAAICPAVFSSDLRAAQCETDNFVITAPSEAFARQVGEAAEYYRHHLAIEWLGQPLPGNWSSKCPVTCKVGPIGAGGATTFTFNNGEVFGWHMSIQGTEERILDSVLPHEVSHMIFASYFRRPLPRWADEGAATLVEHESERLRQTKLLDQVIRTSKRIPLQQLLNIKEYPQNMQDVLTLYAEGYSLADYLVQQKGEHGKTIYLKFLNDAHRHGWDAAFKSHYDTTIAATEEAWSGWVLAGSPPIMPSDDTQLAAVSDRATAQPLRVSAAPVESQQTVIRGQSTEELDPLPQLDRRQRATDAGASLEAPRPRSLASNSPSSNSGAWQPQAYPGERRTAAQPPQPTITEPIDDLRAPRPMQNATDDTGTANGFPIREDSFGPSRPTSFDAPGSATGGMTSPAPISASDIPPGSIPAGRLSANPAAGVTPLVSDEGMRPSHRGFTGGHGVPVNSRGLFPR